VENEDQPSEARITLYGIYPNAPIPLDATIENLPVNVVGSPSGMYFYLDGNSDEKKYDNIAVKKNFSSGYYLYFLPPSLNSTKKTPDGPMPRHAMKIGMTLTVVDNEKQTVIPLESENTVSFGYDVVDTSHVTSIENKIKDAQDAMEQFNGFLYIISLLGGFCLACNAVNIGHQLGTASLSYAAQIFVEALLATALTAIYGALISQTSDEGRIGSATAMGVGFGFGLWLYLSTCAGAGCGTACKKPMFLYGCLVVGVVSVAALVYFMTKLGSVGDDMKSDIDKEVTLAKSSVSDDLSFYYKYGGSASDESASDSD
jgi:hypothetical protein